MQESSEHLETVSPQAQQIEAPEVVPAPIVESKPDITSPEITEQEVIIN